MAAAILDKKRTAALTSEGLDPYDDLFKWLQASAEELGAEERTPKQMFEDWAAKGERKPDEVLKKMAASQILTSAKTVTRYCQLRQEDVGGEKAINIGVEETKHHNVKGDGLLTKDAFKSGISEALLLPPPKRPQTPGNDAWAGTTWQEQQQKMQHTPYVGAERPLFTPRPPGEHWGESITAPGMLWSGQESSRTVEAVGKMTTFMAANYPAAGMEHSEWAKACVQNLTFCNICETGCEVLAHFGSSSHLKRAREFFKSHKRKPTGETVENRWFLNPAINEQNEKEYGAQVVVIWNKLLSTWSTATRTIGPDPYPCYFPIGPSRILVSQCRLRMRPRNKSRAKNRRQQRRRNGDQLLIREHAGFIITTGSTTLRLRGSCRRSSRPNCSSSSHRCPQYSSRLLWTIRHRDKAILTGTST